MLVGRITIGNHCFIGMGAIILPGVTLADNCIVGAGSVVTKSCYEKGSVLAGNPARVVSNTDKMCKKYQDKLFYTHEMTFEQKRKMLLNNEGKFINR